MSQPYSLPHNSLIVSHCKIQHETQYLQGLLAESPEIQQWWSVLAALKDLVKKREAHIETLYECNLQLAEIHWTVTPIIQATIIRNRLADDQLAAIRHQLHRQLCVENNDTSPEVRGWKPSDFKTLLLDYTEQLIAISDFEKTSVFKLFEIIAANIEIPAVSSQ